MKTVFVKPAEGLVVHAPSGVPIPPEGDFLPHDLYVQRRLADGDLVEAEPPQEPTAAPESDPPGAEGGDDAGDGGDPPGGAGTEQTTATTTKRTRKAS